VRVNLIAVGTRMPPWVRAGYDDYARRLGARLPVTLVEIAPGKRTAGGDAARAIADEGKRLLATVKRDDYVVALDERGHERSTGELAAWLKERERDGRSLSVLVGGPDGFAPEVRQRAQETWSLTRLTLPHALVRVLFIEQLYRAVTLLDGHPYHRE
jgi:23S rRNA (pseudouridine1915-N3)-methyltransferase